MRRCELCALQVEDLTWVEDGVRVQIARSKTDQEGIGAEIAILRGCRLRPVEALQAWLRVADIQSGAVFRAVRRGGLISGDVITPDGLCRIVKKLANRIGLDASQFSAHSMRAGFLTSAAQSGATVFKMQEVSLHRSMDVLSTYVRSANLFNAHAGAGFL